MNRRTFVSALGAGSLVGLGGCASRFDEDASIELLQVGVLNWTDEPTTAQIRVFLDDEVVVDETYELEPDGDGRVLDCTWPRDPGQFAVAARLREDDDWETRDLTDPDSECAALWVMIERATGPPSMPISRDCEFYADRC